MPRDVLILCIHFVIFIQLGCLSVVRGNILHKDPDLGEYCVGKYQNGKMSVPFPGQKIPLSKCPRGRDLILDKVDEDDRLELRFALEESDKEVCCPLDQCPTPKHKQADPKNDHFVDSLPEPPVCGVSKNFVVPKVVGGENAPLQAFRWMALLGYKCGDKIQWNGGGSLITRRHVLTAAHCINGVEKYLYVVRLGELDFANETDGASPKDYHIQKIALHEQYDSRTKSNDIGVITLDEDVQFNDFIQPICMPLLADMRSNDFNRYLPFVAGWGATQYGGSKTSHLQYAQLTVMSNGQCEDKYSKTTNTIDGRIICAGSKDNKDACTGDSGGPLMLPKRVKGKHYFFEIGVVSYGFRCGTPGIPGVYSRTTEFLPWISKQTTGKTI